MPDTFNSWFMVTELHLWMLMARVMAHPTYGRKLRNTMVEAFWKDVNLRAKKLGSNNAAAIRSQILELSEAFQAALVSYDEGLLSDDIVLAGAVWRRILERCDDSKNLEAIVCYVRRTMFVLEKLDTDDLILKQNIEWISIKEVLKNLP